MMRADVLERGGAVIQPEQTTPADAPRTRLPELLPVGSRAIAVSGISVAFVVGSFATFGFTGHALLGAVLCPALALLAAIDLRHHLLPNDIIVPTVLVVGLIIAAADPGGFVTHLLAGIALGGLFFGVAVATRGGLGMGDAKLAFLIGLALGWDTVSAAMIAFAGLLLAALWTLAAEGFGARRKAIPFGPFLAIGAILTYFLT